MKVTKNWIIFFSFTFLFNCKRNNSKTEHKIHESGKEMQLDSIQGYWILSEYIDSILSNKSIEKQRRISIAQTSIVIYIFNDSLWYSGLILGNEKLKLNQNNDSLVTIKGMGMENFKLKYDTNLKLINAIQITNYKGEKSNSNFTFRRVRENEKRLTKNISNKPFYENLEDNFYSFFIDSLIVGKYTSTNNKKDFIIFEKNESVSGFKKYNKYIIHDYFGTHHPYNSKDVLILEDTTATTKENYAPPNNIDIFSWKFKNDTLILIEMLTDNYENFHEGSIKYKFKKSAANTK